MTLYQCSDDEALRRQLELSIKLVFSGEDPVGVYSLAAHVLEQARLLAASRKEIGDHGTFFDHVLPGKTSDFWNLFDAPYDFTAHADGIPEWGEGAFDDRVNDIVLLLACSYYQYADMPTSTIVNLYLCWTFLAYHDLMKEDSPVYAFYNTMRDMIVLPDFPNFSRADQLSVGRKLIKDNADAFVWPTPSNS